jgi:hypothetical protein
MTEDHREFHVLPVSTDLHCIVPSNIETSEESLRKKVEYALLLTRGRLPRDDDGPREEDGGSKRMGHLKVHLRKEL